METKDILKTFNDWQKRDIERLKTERKRQQNETFLMKVLFFSFLALAILCAMCF